MLMDMRLSDFECMRIEIMVATFKVDLQKSMFSKAHKWNLIMKKSANTEFQTAICQWIFKIEAKQKYPGILVLRSNMWG